MELYEIRNGLEKAHLQIENFHESLRIEDYRREVLRLTDQSMQEDFWNDPQKAKKVLDELNSMKKIVDQYDQLSLQLKDLEEMLELAKEDAELFDLLEEDYASFMVDYESFEKETLFSGPYDHQSCILEIHPGAGGTESQDWANMLFRMYTRFAQSKGLGVEVLDYLDGEEAGIKSVTVSITGYNAYGMLKCEKGVHRLVRISPFDSNSRRHTSFASVEVIPEFDGSTQDIEIRSEDIRIDTYRASGAGGQHINKTDSAVRITHLPTGIVVSCQSQRSQIQNREKAMMMLVSKLKQKAVEEQEAKLLEIRGEQKEIAWGSQIRSYVFHPYSMVKDLRTGYETGNVQAVMDGDLDGFIDAYLKFLVGR